MKLIQHINFRGVPQSDWTEISFKRGVALIETSPSKNGGSVCEIAFSLEIGKYWDFPLCGLFEITYNDGSSQIYGTQLCPAVVEVSHQRVTRIVATVENSSTKLY